MKTVINQIISNAHLIVIVMAVIAAIATFLFIILLGKEQRNAIDKTIKTYELINNKLKEKKNGIINYDKINNFLEKNGVKYHYPFLNDPIKFITISIISGTLFMLIGMLFNYLLGIILLFVGLFFPYKQIKDSNKKDNEIILEDIKTIYSSLATQIKCGVYIINALNECSSSDVIQNKRLLQDMQELCSDIYLTNDLTGSLEKFIKKYDNLYISSLSIIITQSIESGKAYEALEDISEQLKEVDKNLLLLKKQRKQYRNTGYQFAILITTLLTIFIVVVPEIVKMLMNF